MKEILIKELKSRGVSKKQIEGKSAEELKDLIKKIIINRKSDLKKTYLNKNLLIMSITRLEEILKYN